MGNAKFEIEFDAVGHDSVIVNGEDITRNIAALQVDSSMGEATVLRINFKPGASGRIKGEGIVEITVPVDVNALLASLNPHKIQQEAMDKLGWGEETNIAALVIEILREKINASQFG